MTLPGFTPWPPEEVAKYKAKGNWQGLTLGDIFDQAVSRSPDKLALVGETDRVTFSQMKEKVDRLALGLLEVGIKKNDRVLLQLHNCPELLYFYFALAKIGAISVMALRHFRKREIEYLLRLTQSVAIAIPDEFRGFNYLQMRQELPADLTSLKHTLIVGKNVPAGMVSVPKILQEPKEKKNPTNYLQQFKPDAGEVAVLLLTGGTTAFPKGVPRTHNDYICNAQATTRVREWHPGIVSLICVPLAHNVALIRINSWMLVGCKMVIQNSTRTEDILQTIQKEKVTEIFMVPTQIVDLLNFPDLHKYDLSSLTTISSGAAHVAPELVNGVRSKLGCIVMNVFGMAEGPVISTRPKDPVEVVSETVGRPCCPEDEFRILDDAGKDVPVGVEGELAARGPHCFRGYYLAPEENKKSFTPNGFFFSGDLAIKRPDGNYQVTGRKKEVILRGGENVSAVELEELLLTHPKIVDVAVVGMPDPRLGEKACAYVTLKKGESLTLEEVVDYLQKKEIAAFKLPERLEVISEFPLTNIGKISKKDLKEDIIRKLKAEGVI